MGLVTCSWVSWKRRADEGESHRWAGAPPPETPVASAESRAIDHREEEEEEKEVRWQ